MQNPPKVENGDRVRVVLEGEAREIGTNAFNIGSSGLRNRIYSDLGHVVSVEVLAKPVKVGDIIEGQAAYEALPIGALVKNSNTGKVRIRVKDGFIDPSWPSVVLPTFHYSDPRTLVYLP